VGGEEHRLAAVRRVPERRGEDGEKRRDRDDPPPRARPPREEGCQDEGVGRDERRDAGEEAGGRPQARRRPLALGTQGEPDREKEQWNARRGREERPVEVDEGAVG